MANSYEFMRIDCGEWAQINWDKWATRFINENIETLPEFGLFHFMMTNFRLIWPMFVREKYDSSADDPGARLPILIFIPRFLIRKFLPSKCNILNQIIVNQGVT